MEDKGAEVVDEVVPHFVVKDLRAKGVGKGKKVKAKEPVYKQPRVEIDLEDNKSKAIMDLLTRCVEPPLEEKLATGELRRSIREIRDLGRPRRMDFSDAEINKIQHGKKKMARRKLSKDRRYAESEL